MRKLLQGHKLFKKARLWSVLKLLDPDLGGPIVYGSHWIRILIQIHNTSLTWGIVVRFLVIDLETGEERILEAHVDAHNVEDDGVGLVRLQGRRDGKASLQSAESQFKAPFIIKNLSRKYIYKK